MFRLLHGVTGWTQPLIASGSWLKALAKSKTEWEKAKETPGGTRLNSAKSGPFSPALRLLKLSDNANANLLPLPARSERGKGENRPCRCAACQGVRTVIR